MNTLTHLNQAGEAVMVDVSAKIISERIATAQAVVSMSAELFAKIQDLPKGDALACARIAGIMAAKKTSDLIPLCHPLALSKVEIQFELLAETSQIRIKAICKVSGQTGVEMEALTAASIAALTIHDMGKAVDPSIDIGQIHLLEKTGGKSGNWSRHAK